MATLQFKTRPSTGAIFVHCSATKSYMDIGAREIRQWHKEKGWLDIGYHFVIKRDGTVETGRPVDTIGAHVEGWNNRSVGVCLVGGIDYDGKAEANFTDAQMSSLKEKLADLLEMYPDAVVKAHHDVAQKSCPSFNVSKWLKTGQVETSEVG